MNDFSPEELGRKRLTLPRCLNGATTSSSGSGFAAATSSASSSLNKANCGVSESADCSDLRQTGADAAGHSALRDRRLWIAIHKATA